MSKKKRNNLREMRMFVQSQTKYHIEQGAKTAGMSTGQFIDKLIRSWRAAMDSTGMKEKGENHHGHFKNQ